MKCDELKDYDIMDVEAYDDKRLEESKSGKIQVTRVYMKHQVDEAIAEMKDKLRETKRALWLARARTAHLEVKCFVHDMYDDDATAEESAKDEIMANKWYKVKLLCIKKAKEYK